MTLKPSLVFNWVMFLDNTDNKVFFKKEFYTKETRKKEVEKKKCCKF